MRRTIVVLSLIVVAAGLAAAGRIASRPPSEIIRPPAVAASLDGKFDWALREAPKAGPGRVYWVGYCVDKLMGENSFIGSVDIGGRRREPTVAEILAGKTIAAEDIRGAAKAALDEIDRRTKPERKVLKEIGVFLRYDVGKTPALSRVHVSNLDLSFDFEASPLFWLGRATEGQSLSLVKALYDRSAADEIRQGLVGAAGCLGPSGLVIPFLADVLAGDGSDALRKDAAFWIGQQADPDGLRLLVRTARSDKSEEVREGAVFAISEIDLPAAVDELIALARSADSRDVRKQAVFWIGQMASEKSGEALEEFARKDGDFEIQEQAVFALSQLPDSQGIEPLIKLAKTHPDPRVRKKAVFWLGESGDPRALETLVAIIKGK